MTHRTADPASRCPGILWYAPAHRPGAGPFAMELGWPILQRWTHRRDGRTVDEKRVLWCRCGRCRQRVAVVLESEGRVAG